ncbi:MAG: hypothetical protein IVW52_09400 [Acidimicrobiales bacterium]|nr:hypothetical protein [Acidimicrobiales bacterium]
MAPRGRFGAGNTLTDETVSPSGVNELAQRWRSHRANAAADSLDLPIAIPVAGSA